MTLFQDYENKTGLSVFDPQNMTILREFVNREVIQNMSLLVQHFLENPESLNGSEWSWDEVMNIAGGYDYEEAATDMINDWAIDELCDFLFDYGPVTVPEPILDHVIGLIEKYWTEEQVRAHIYEILDATAQDSVYKEGEISEPGFFDKLRNYLKYTFPEDHSVIEFLDWKMIGQESQDICDLEKALRKLALDVIRAAENVEEICQDYYVELENYRYEALEFWSVTGWFARKLEEKGESVGELSNLGIWGRRTSGQAILLDTVVAEIALEMEILTGQKNDWSKSGIV